MKIMGIDNELHPGITMHKIPVKSGFPGVLFTIGVMAVYLMGIPTLIYFIVPACVVGIGFAVHAAFHPSPGRSCSIGLECRYDRVSGWHSGHRLAREA